MGIFNIERYPINPVGGGIAYSKTEIDNIWLNFHYGKVSLMFGDINDFIGSHFTRLHSKEIVTIELKEHSQNIDGRYFNGRYRLCKKGNVFEIDLYLTFKRIQMPRLEYHGKIIRGADYKYYQEILKRQEAKRKEIYGNINERG